MQFSGCTHYPLIQNEIKEVLGKDIIFFNGAPNLAKHLKDILKEKDILEKSNRGTIKFIDSQNLKQKEERFYEYLRSQFRFLNQLLMLT